MRRTYKHDGLRGQLYAEPWGDPRMGTAPMAWPCDARFRVAILPLAAGRSGFLDPSNTCKEAFRVLFCVFPCIGGPQIAGALIIIRTRQKWTSNLWKLPIQDINTYCFTYF